MRRHCIIRRHTMHMQQRGMVDGSSHLRLATMPHLLLMLMSWRPWNSDG